MLRHLHILILILSIAFTTAVHAADRPNFLWVTSEDNSPYLGCYGDAQAQTPNLDKLASEGIRFRNFFANAPVCSAARSTLIAGMYGSSLGIQNHRSKVAIPDSFKTYPEVLRAAGYYCTNNSKTDYNIVGRNKIWDESSNKAHYKNRKPGQPFFAVFNFTSSHESQVAPKAGKTTFRIPPEKIVLPPYHPDEPDIRRDWANYYDQMTIMDGQVGAVIDELKRAGLAEDTFIFYYGDHGGAMPGGKRSIQDRGTRVPLVVRIPGKWAKASPVAAGQWVDDLATFVDLPPTVFNLAGIETPKNYQGKPFLGEGRTAPRDEVFMHRGRMDERYDFSRSVRTQNFRYVRNYSPHRPWGQNYSYPFQVQPSMRAWYASFEAGRCNEAQAAYWKPKAASELYAITTDPFELANLASKGPQNPKVAELHQHLVRQMTETRDTGFIPEGMVPRLAGDKTIYDYAQSNAYPIGDIISLADIASDAQPEALPEFIKLLKHEHPVMRYWAATGCLILKDKAAPAKDALLAALADPMADVRVVAAEALGYIGETEKAVAALQGVLRDGNVYESLAALNTLDFMTGAGHVPLARAQAMVKDLKLAEPADRIQKFILDGRKWR
ncbi:sulfatase-like hydrolase/transferase [Humisphaera borealis]|uniref:Sulfatase-like hydrolase/transferase n=1 Tax=Humisphaera borealis TaxID=2807512 RepID=A0A7M2WTK5_9BACT|nr:sulfatase-like hydrolase/transferase [Humisphaera borealis]QOV88848.1 sulfatase-like hydrolase/transferase [Humisphaera borealis]